jgi:UDPglucose 6-dehydrogenase
MNPEFLREGRALEDFLNPDRVVIGSYGERSGSLVSQLYENFNAPILLTNLKTAEMIKYASNSLLATKISFSNEIGNVCKKLGIDVYDVMKGVGMDSRLSPEFLNAGAGFGGSCFPKDVAAIVAKGREVKQDMGLLENVIDVNRKQRKIVVDMLESRVGDLKGKRIAILGLAFKPDSDDIREAPSIDIIKWLKERGAMVAAYDPEAAENMKQIYPEVEYCKSAGECIKSSDACLVLTDWDEFRRLGDGDFKAMKSKVIIECRKTLDPAEVSGFEGICWPGNRPDDGSPSSNHIE